MVSSRLGFRARDVVGGTGMGVLTGAWLSVALIQLTSPPGAPEARTTAYDAAGVAYAC